MFTPRELLFYHLAYERKNPQVVVCAVMQIKKSMYYVIKKEVENKIEREYRRKKIAGLSNQSCIKTE